MQILKKQLDIWNEKNLKNEQIKMENYYKFEKIENRKLK